MNRDETKTDIQQFEERLKKAMIASDVTELDELLAEELIFTNHLGQIMNKQDDLSIHKSGKMHIQKIDLSDQRIVMAGPVAIVSVQASILGDWGGGTSESLLRFTRVWKKDVTHKWQVIAGHSTQIVV